MERCRRIRLILDTEHNGVPCVVRRRGPTQFARTHLRPCSWCQLSRALVVQYDKIHARGDALLDSASSMIWVGDCKTYFEGVLWRSVQNLCTERCNVGFLFVFTWVGDCKTNFETFCTAVFMPLIQGVEMSTRCQMCRPVARRNGGSEL